MYRGISAAVLTLGLSVVGGCGTEDATREVAPATELAAVSPAGDVGSALSDPQIAHIAVTANAIDVETGHLAEARTANPDVLAFARTMITDHTAVYQQAAALAQRLGVTPEENAVSRSLQADAEAARAELQDLRGDAFDRGYIDREVAYHQAVLDALDQTLIPEATNEELRGFLQQVRPAIAAHLAHAQSLQSGLASK